MLICKSVCVCVCVRVCVCVCVCMCVCELLEEGAGVMDSLRLMDPGPPHGPGHLTLGPHSWHCSRGYRPWPRTSYQGTWVQTQGWRRGPIRDSWLDKEKEGATSCPRSPESQWRGDRLLLSAGQDALTPLTGREKDPGLCTAAPGLLLSVQSCPCRASARGPWPPWAAGGVLWGGSHPGQGSQGCGPKLSFILQSSFK